MEVVEKTKSGLFIKKIEKRGTLIFSPYTGFSYAVHPNFSNDIIRWLNLDSMEFLSNVFEESLGAGWAYPLDNIKPHNSFLLPDKAEWKDGVLPESIIGINWFITGKCNLDCLYCYATDLMRNNVREPNKEIIISTAKNILKYKPLFVVITGGEPLCSPFIETAFKELNGKTGIIVDTNGLNITKKFIKLCKDYNVAVRVSIDSERPNIQHFQRPFFKNRSNQNSLFKIVENINNCINESLPIIVQSVITKNNANELVELGNKLYRLGIHFWRILRIQETAKNSLGYKKLMCDLKKPNHRWHSSVDYNLRVIQKYSRNWPTMSVHITQNYPHQKNSVILVAPDGKFYTESIFGDGKVIIDNDKPKIPSQIKMKEKINFFEHLSRYLFFND